MEDSWKILLGCLSVFLFVELCRGSLDIGSVIGFVAAVVVAWFLNHKKEEANDAYTQTDDVISENIDRSSQTESCTGVDETLDENTTGPLVADAVVDKIQQASVFSNDRMLLRRIALAETDDGQKLDPTGQALRGGIWQLDENDFKDSQDTAKNKGLRPMYRKMRDEFKIDWPSVTWSDLNKPMYSGLAARLKIYLIPQEIPWSLEDQAKFWKQKYSTQPKGPSAEHFKKIAHQFEQESMISCADVAFLLDGSTSVGPKNFDKMKNFVNEVTKSFSVSADGVRIGLIVFSTNSKVEFHLGTHKSQAELSKAIETVEYPAHRTYTHRGLEDLRIMIKKSGRPSSSGVPRIAIVVTDGKSDDFRETKLTAQKVHEENITVFAVGVTHHINQEELECIASQKDSLHVFNLDTFKDVEHFNKEIQKRSSRVSVAVPIGSSFAGSLHENKKQCYTINITKKGVHVKLHVKTGSCAIYISYIYKHPSAALYHYMMEVDSSMASGSELFLPSQLLGLDEVKQTYATLFGTGEGMNSFQLETS